MKKFFTILEQIISESEELTYTMYSGITQEAWEKIWQNKNFIDKETNVTSDIDFALDYSYNFKTGKYEDLVVEISNIPLDVFIAYRSNNYKNDSDFKKFPKNLEKKKNIIETKKLFLVDLFKVKNEIKINLLKI
jgi:hypothetical protein